MALRARKNGPAKGKAKANQSVIVIASSSSDDSTDDEYSFKDIEHYDFGIEELEDSSQPMPSGHDSSSQSRLEASQRSSSFASISHNSIAKNPRARRHRAITAIPRFRSAKTAGSNSCPVGLSQGAVGSPSGSVSHIDQRAADPSSADVGDMWWKQYEPQSVDDLGVHNGKIAQVRGWLEMAMQPAAAGPSAFARILVVEGPAGAGKSTCVRVLAKELGLGVVEWINPLSGRSSVAGALGFDIDEVGVVEQFAAFLKRAERYTPLQLDASGEVSGSRGSAPSTRGQIVLVDDLPNILHRDTRESFRSALLRFISIPARQSFPLVIVVTESFSTQDLLDDASRRSWRLRDDDKSANTEVATWCASDIIPSAVYSSAYCQSIKFNPVAPTIVSKGLKRILQIRQGLEGQKNVRFSPECTAAVKAISSESGGDIRSAITMLQLTQAAYTGMSSQSLTPRKRSRATKLVTGSDVVEGKNVAATRSVSLDLFHALGKVLYAKRGPPGTADSNSGRGRLESSPSQIIGHLPVDVSTFNLFVHENSVDFCGSLDELTEALSYFSDADVVSSRGRTKHDAFETAAEIYSGMLTMHGFMHAKGHPELAGSGVPLHDQASQGSHRSSIQAFRKPMFFESYKKRMYNSRLASGLTAVDLFDLGSNAPTLAAWGGRMIDSLAFWAQIVPRRPGSSSLVRQRNPIVYQQLIDLAMASDRPGPCGQDGTGLAAGLPGAVGSARMELQKLVLSDDDIEDFSD